MFQIATEKLRSLINFYPTFFPLKQDILGGDASKFHGPINFFPIDPCRESKPKNPADTEMRKVRSWRSQEIAGDRNEYLLQTEGTLMTFYETLIGS